MSRNSFNIELRFGHASTQERQKHLDKCAIDFDISMEKALLIEFEEMFYTSWMRKDSENIFELLLFILTGKKIICREVSFGTYLFNKSKFPKVIIHRDSLNVCNADEQLVISNEIADQLGKELDLYFEYEYVESMRVKN